ncbi:MAG: hypothetical protein DCC88_06745 [Spirobacillus cienkowskii]|jgi:hypothetical protein|uniref:Uncharacterized protein n=1 Tax=Spirobacillus cienkowskii TaxID=495820 RepID=A0A369KTB3_9BACT|nr:MAG: hypothetical protein DCC88_06745 [Spirobacillus cienkowskii]
MELPCRVYTSLQNKHIRDELRKVVRTFKADKFFNYIDPNIINTETLECINFGSDYSGLTSHYVFLDIYSIDPFLNQFKYTRKQTFHFKELEMSQIKMQRSNLRVGVVLNEERSKIFQVHNGMYRTIPINKKYSFVCVYGSDQKDFIFDTNFSLGSDDGKWFYKFEFALLEVVKKYLINIERKS